MLFLSVLHFIGDEENPGQIVAGFRERLPAGGYLVISAITSENMDQEMAAGASELYRSARTPGVARSREQIMEFFAGCQLEEPGLVNVVQWRPDAGTDTRATQVHMLGGVGRKSLGRAPAAPARIRVLVLVTRLGHNGRRNRAVPGTQVRREPICGERERGRWGRHASSARRRFRCPYTAFLASIPRPRPCARISSGQWPGSLVCLWTCPGSSRRPRPGHCAPS